MDEVKGKAVTWNVFELEFKGVGNYESPYTDVVMGVEFTSPEGVKLSIPGFWDGGNTWKVRFAPFLSGYWKWQSIADIKDEGLHGKSGEVFVEEYSGENQLYSHGFLKINENGRGFCHDDGKPFFWLGDTLWSCPSKATMDEWKELIAVRSAQGFNVAQVNSLPQHDCSGVNDYRIPFEIGEEMWDLKKLKPEYFQYFDEQMRITAEAGMVTAMVVLWFDYVPGANPTWGVKRKAEFSTEDASRYGRYLAARYGAFGPTWLISGDSDYINPDVILTYDAAARAIREGLPYKPLMTAHLYGELSTPSNLEQKEWLDFHMYQSSHNKRSEHVAAKCSAECRAYQTVKPVLNGEPIYEQIGFYRESGCADRGFIRKTGWYSILSGGNAGITYGAHGLWSWHREGEEFFPEAAWHMPADWKAAIKFEGSDDYARMKNFFEKQTWWELEPAPQIYSEELKDQIIVAASKDRSFIVAYAKDCSSFNLELPEVSEYKGSWFNPVSEEEVNAELEVKGNTVNLKSVPWKGEAVLVLRA